jgi:hypothetical protein
MRRENPANYNYATRKVPVDQEWQLALRAEFENREGRTQEQQLR